MKVLTPGIRLLISLASVVVIIGGLRYAGNFLVPVILSFFLAVLNLPITNWLVIKRVPHVIAILITVLVNLAVLGGLAFLGLTVVSNFQSKAAGYVLKLYEKAEDWVIGLTARIKDIQTSLQPIAGGEKLAPGGTGAEVAGTNEGTGIDLEESIEQGEKTLLELLDLQVKEVIGFITDTQLVQNVASLLSTSFFVFVVMIFIMTEAPSITHRLLQISEAKGPDLSRLTRASQDIQRYLGIKSAVSLATGLLASLLTWSLGLEFPILWGLLAFVLNYIPAIGSVIASIPPALLALLEFGWLQCSLVVLGYLGINMLLGNVIEPMLLGKRFGLSTLVVILSVLFWGWLWGPIGMFLGVPMTMMVKVMLDNTEEFRWISVAMGKYPVPRRMLRRPTGRWPQPATASSVASHGSDDPGEVSVEAK